MERLFLADAVAAFLNAGLKPSTGTQSGNIRFAIDSGLIMRFNGVFLVDQDAVLELTELMERFPFD